MKSRIATIMGPEDLGAAGTKTLNIDIQDVISRISLIWKFTVATVSVMTARVIDCITKIELVDGADVLVSLSGSQLAGLNAYNRRRLPYSQGSLTVGGYCEQMIGLDFGRWLYDEYLALRPGLFNNLQLKITWNEDAANGSVVVNECSVYAHVMEDLEKQPIGFLAGREYKEYNYTASSHEYTDLPVDAKIRTMLLQLESEDHDPVALLDTIKLSLDNGKRVPIDMPFDAFYREMKSKYPRFNYGMTLDDAVTAKTIYANLSKDLQTKIEYDNTLFVTAQSKLAEATYTGHKIALAASADVKALRAEILGECPFSCVAWLTGDEWDVNQWFDPALFKNLQLDLKASSDADSGDSCKIALEQLRMY